MRTAKSTAWINSTLVAAALLCAVAAAPPQVAAQTSGPNLSNPNEIRFVRGRILVQPRAGLRLEELDRKLKAHGGRRVGVIQQINVHIVELPPQASERAVAQLLRGDRHLRFAEVDLVLPPALTPNDPQFTSGWHLPKIGAPTAWDTSVGTGVTIAILDSGVDATHPDLAAHLVPGYNAYDKNNDTTDVSGHGTLVAGSAAMIGNNLVGGAGVAFRSRIMPVRVTRPDGWGNLSAMAAGLTWAADNGARVANLSFQQSCGSSTLINAANYFRSKGGVVVIAAGNSGTEESMVASDAITCVAATDSNDQRTSWSTYGPFVDVAAPGASIFTTTRGGGYGHASGTSFAAPVTAGIYALMLAANPRLSPAQLDEALFSTAVDLGTAGKDVYHGHGRVDAAAAVAKVRTTSTVDTTPPTTAILAPTANAKVNGLVEVDVHASDDVGVTRVELYADGRLIASETKAPYLFSWDPGSLSGSVQLEARAFDAAGNVGRSQVVVTVDAAADDTTPPTVRIVNPTDGAVVKGGSVSISAQATDNVRVAKISLMINGREVALVYGSSLNYSWALKGRHAVAAGTYTVTATATDTAGNEARTSIRITVP